jgi:hypothetical protein
MYMKKKTTEGGAPTSKKNRAKAWVIGWDDIPQEKIQAWIERSPFHIQEVIRLEGGNEYKESKSGRRRNPD